MISCGGCVCPKIETRLIPAYEADMLGAPFRVILENAVREEWCSSCNTKLKTTIPDLDGLLRAVARTRALCPRKLIGAEIKFFRHAMGWKGKKLAESLGLSPEHLSRCEHGTKQLSVSVEKWLRVFVLYKMVSKEVRERVDIDEILDMKIQSVWDVDDLLELHFYRGRPDDKERAEGNDAEWQLDAAA
jgi:transcriptional regulator with XRE-family HTH domain